jgi:nitrous oxidase accessory protein NosD
MYGCGTVGLDLYGAADVTVNRSTIYECSAFVMDLYHSTGIQMTDCVFRDNEGGVNIDTVSNLVIDACSFQNNTDYDLLTILQSNAVIVRNTAFIGNDAEELLYQADSEIDLDDSNHFEGNAFD